MKITDKLIDEIIENIDNRIMFFEARLEDETNKEKRKFIEGNIAGLRLAKIQIPLKETVGVECDDV